MPKIIIDADGEEIRKVSTLSCPYCKYKWKNVAVTINRPLTCWQCNHKWWFGRDPWENHE